MSEVLFQCSVNKSHVQKKQASLSAPFCCGKPMVKIDDNNIPAVSTSQAHAIHGTQKKQQAK
jgi:hypothetical protein